MQEKQWIYKEVPLVEKIKTLSKTINVSTPTACLLLQRSIDDFPKAKHFFRAGLQQLHDPFQMRDMHKAAERLTEAVQKGQKILFYGDYDVDGTTSVSLLSGFFRNQSVPFEFYIPDRYSEGYGLSDKAVTYIIQQNIDLVITLDCGIKAVEKIARAKAAGVDFIVCDHHTPGASLPPAFAVLDPKRRDCPYPYKELSGCGVGFKLLQAYCRLNRIDEREVFKYLDLVAISIASDIVPITGENRILARFGLQQINKEARVGIQALINIAGLRPPLSISGIVFGIGPRINAAGRIGHAKEAVHLLLSEEEAEAKSLAKSIDTKNEQRKDYDTNTTDEVLAMIEEFGLQNRKTTVLYNPDWHKGVIGIVASRCIERYYRPTIILTQSQGKITGSARSVENYDIYTAIEACEDLLEQYGGHKYAAGLTLDQGNLEAFALRFEEVVSQSITQDLLTPKIYIDLKLSLDQINPNFYQVVQQMAPFGPENMQPVFVSEGVIDSGYARVLKDRHLKLKVKQANGQQVLDAIGFNMAGFYPLVASGRPFQVCYSIEENTYNGRTSLQLMLRDIKG
ncbi:single-stranded-DNA-specific exonuclease RecJ [Rapidithrix thailandica]|uniref:Single-stranded-DNA-specific exonuclease RecJ n=1 Tax=Rapidithrix thailandica TaxID=413964 RepID=A0AAW9SA95_9BACT